MTDEELREMVAGLAVSQAETGRLIQELADKAERRHAETEELFRKFQQEADRRQAETDRQLRALSDNIGGLNNKFGSFTEALAFPSMEKVLTEEFEMEFIDPDVRRRRGRNWIQIDVLAHSNTGRNAVVVVEIKSRLREDGIDQLHKILEEFFDFFPEHRGKELFAILAVVESPEDLRSKVLGEGIYLAQISDHVFQLEVPKDFEPRSFSMPTT